MSADDRYVGKNGWQAQLSNFKQESEEATGKGALLLKPQNPPPLSTLFHKAIPPEPPQTALPNANSLFNIRAYGGHSY